MAAAVPAAAFFWNGNWEKKHIRKQWNRWMAGLTLVVIAAAGMASGQEAGNGYRQIDHYTLPDYSAVPVVAGSADGPHPGGQVDRIVLADDVTTLTVPADIPPGRHQVAFRIVRSPEQGGPADFLCPIEIAKGDGVRL